MQNAVLIHQGNAVGGSIPDISTALGNIETIGSACVNPDGYTAGSYFVGSNGLFYVATSNISQGAIITVGSNCEQTSVSASLTEKIEQKQGSISSGTYTGIALDWISYDETKKQMILHKKGAGADSVIPFSGGTWIKLGGTRNTAYTYEDSTGISISESGESAFTTAVNSSGGLMYDLVMDYTHGYFNYKVKFDGVHVLYQQYAMVTQSFTKDTTITPYSTGQAVNTMAYGMGDIFIAI